VRLTSTSAGAGPAGFAGDGSYAYFTVEDATERRILFSVKTDGSGRMTALSPPSVSVHVNDYFDGVSADPSPDGSKIVFVADVTNTRRALYVVNTRGGKVRRIDTPDIDPTSAQWSPDGSWIAFSARPPTANASYDVYLIHPDGRGMTAVTSPADGCSGYAPIWSPDGTKLLFETQCSNGSTIISTTLETANVDGSESSKVVDLNGLTAYSLGRLAKG
jgi:Tol biopolymer transport system component